MHQVLGRVAGWSVYSINYENINNGGSAYKVSGKLWTDMDWHNVEEEWCQGDLLPVYSFPCLAYIYPITLAMEWGGVGSGGRAGCPLLVELVV